MGADSREQTLVDQHLGSAITAREKRKPEPQSQNQSVRPSVSRGTMSSPAYNTEGIIPMTSVALTKPRKRGLVEYFPVTIYMYRIHIVYIYSIRVPV